MQAHSSITNTEQKERFSIFPSSKTLTNRSLENIDYSFKSKVLVPYSEKFTVESVIGIPDDNRSVIITDSTIDIENRDFFLSVKGAGARNPLYGTNPLDYTLRSDFSTSLHNNLENSTPREITHENWFGESPYGAHGLENAIFDLKISESFFNFQLDRFNICPVIEITEVPFDYIKEREQFFWYRRFTGPFYQEKRLVPSNIRLFHQSDLTLGQSPDIVLKRFGIFDSEGLDQFINNYIASGLAIITVLVRSLTFNSQTQQFEALDFTDVWLDKDSIIAPDGTIFFIDLEGLDWINIPNQEILKKKVLKQINRNYYEFMYCLDLLLKEKDNLLSRHSSQRQKRETLATYIDLATIGDPFLKTELQTTYLDLIIDPKHNFEQIKVRFLDLI